MFKPMGKRVLCLQIVEEAVAGAVVLTKKSTSPWYTVISVGDEVHADIKPGSVVMLPSFTTEIVIGVVKHQIVQDGEIMGVDVPEETEG